MKSYKYRLLHISSLAIDKALDEVNKLFQLKFYKNKLIKSFNNINLSPYQILFSLRNILEYSRTRTRTLFYFYINNIKFICLSVNIHIIIANNLYFCDKINVIK